MKIFQVNFLSVVLLVVLLSLVLLLPSWIIQNVWNATYMTYMERDLQINLGQAALLWGALLAAVYMSGLFKFKIDFKTIDAIDLESIQDPELKREIEKLRAISTHRDNDKKDDHRD